VSLAALKPLLESKACRFYSLQKGEASGEIAANHLTGHMTDYMTDVDNLMDTAALIENLDLVISVDTSVAHLAGGLGKPVWILSRFGGCWRWLQNKETNPWYPTARIFGQPEPGDWKGCINQVVMALQELPKIQQ
jgi:ADP-heptose:LPS heptosyltransferase